MLTTVFRSASRRYCTRLPAALPTGQMRGELIERHTERQQPQQVFTVHIPDQTAPGLITTAPTPESVFRVVGNPSRIIIDPDLLDEAVREFHPPVVAPGIALQTASASKTVISKPVPDMVTIDEYIQSLSVEDSQRYQRAEDIASQSNQGKTIEETIRRVGRVSPNEIEELISLIGDGKAGFVSKFKPGDDAKIEEYYAGFQAVEAARQAGVGEQGLEIIQKLIDEFVPQKASLSDVQAREIYNVFDLLIPHIANKEGSLLSIALQKSVLRNIARDFIRASMKNRDGAKELAVREPNKGFLELISRKADLTGKSFSEILESIQGSVSKTRGSYNEKFLVDFSTVRKLADFILQYAGSKDRIGSIVGEQRNREDKLRN